MEKWGMRVMGENQLLTFINRKSIYSRMLILIENSRIVCYIHILKLVLKKSSEFKNAFLKHFSEVDLGTESNTFKI